MTPDLPENYYLDNVLLLFAHVESLYGDILEPAQRDFLQTFAGLGEDAKKLYIRLLNRNHLCFRRSKLNYAEIGSIDDAIVELEQSGCLQLNADIGAEAMISLFSKAELIEWFGQDAELKKLKRAQLEAALLQRDHAGMIARLRQQDDWLQLNHQDEYQLCQMLFFGNLNQSMTDFVLRDLGLNQYENYLIDPEHRPYRSRLEIQQHWLLQQLELQLELSDGDDVAELLDHFAMIPLDIAPDSPAYGKSDRLRFKIARQLERLGELSRALPLYRQCLLPPGRERIARIHAQQNRPQQALDLCLAMIEDPIDDSESHFACQFGARLIKRHRLDAQESVELNRIIHQPDTIELELDYHESVEIAVAEHYQHCDGNCYFLENSLFNGVLGMLLWEVIFAALPGAFFNPFQYRPSDLYAHDFFDRRAALIDELWSSIDNNEDMRRRLDRCWREKYGLMNPLVNWQALNPEIIDLALQRIEHAHWRAVFERILDDLHGNRAGFPDLIHFPAAGGYCLIEVKGPGDSLQKNQQRWMQYFQQHGIAHKLAKVRWRQD